MEEFHIFISGEIAPDSDPLAAEMGIYGLNHLVRQFEKFPNAKKAIIHINSPGGDVSEGFAMHDFLIASGKEIETIIEGKCASIATVVFLAGSTRKITENSEFFIHNPWMETQGDATELRKMADALQKTEDIIASFYHEKTGGDINRIREAMKVETTFSADEAINLGFATEKIHTVSAKAKAILNFSKNVMAKNKLSLTQRLSNAVKALKGAKNLDLTLADGTAITVDAAGEDIAVGDAVFIDGSPAADGEYKLADGKILVVSGGVVAEVKVAEPPTDPAPEANQDEEEEEEEKEQVSAIAKALETIANSVKAQGETLASLKAEFSSLKTVQANQAKNVEQVTEAVELIGSNLHSAGFKGIKKKQVFNKDNPSELTPEEQKARAIAAMRKKAGLLKEKEGSDE